MKKKKKKKTKSSSLPPSSSPPSFTFCPDEISLNCLARISRSYYPKLSVVSKSFHSLISSTELYTDRSHRGNIEQCLYVCLQDRSYQFPQWFTLWVNPNPILPESSATKKKKKKKRIGQLLVPIPSSNFPSLSKCIVVVGYEIYVIGGPINGAPSSAVRVLDCCTHTWRDASSMNVARAKASSCVYDGKIYVLGGCEGFEEYESWAEVFDIKTQTWECLSDPGDEIRKLDNDIYRVKEIKGKINFGTAYEMYAYDTRQGKWESYENISETFVRSECVIGDLSYSYGYSGCRWYDTNYNNWEDVKGLGSLREKYMRNGGSTDNKTKVVSCGGKLLVIWEGYMKHNPNGMKKIWCAEIVVEKRDGGEVWGNVQWVDVVHTVPISCRLMPPSRFD